MKRWIAICSVLVCSTVQAGTLVLPVGLASDVFRGVVGQYHEQVAELGVEPIEVDFGSDQLRAAMLGSPPDGVVVIYGRSNQAQAALKNGWRQLYQRDVPVAVALFARHQLAEGAPVAYTDVLRPAQFPSDSIPFLTATPAACLRAVFSGLAQGCYTSPRFAANYQKRFNVTLVRLSEPEWVFNPSLFVPLDLPFEGAPDKFVVNRLTWRLVD